MAERTTILTPPPGPSAAPGHYVDWPAIFAGAVVAAAIGVVFAGFGAALGLSAISAERGEGNGTLSLILTGLWALITLLLAYGAGGYVAGRMRRRVDTATGDEVQARDAIHGMVVWALGILVGAWMAGSILGSAANAVGNVASGAAQAVGAVAQGVGTAAAGAAEAATGEGGLDLSGFNPIEAVNNRLLRGTGTQIDQDATLSPVARDILFETARTGELTDADRAILAQEVAANTNLSQQEVNARIDEAVARIEELRAQADQALAEAEQAARDAAEAARRGAVLTGFLAAAAAVLALGAAMYGAGLGGRHRDEGQFLSWFRTW
jgi:hypothetical protein